MRTFKVREKFLELVDGLVAFSGALVDLAEIVVGEDFARNSFLPQDFARGEGPYSTRKIPKLAHLHQCLDSTSPKNYFAQKSTALLV